MIVCCSVQFAQSSKKVVYNAESKSIIVPEGNRGQVKTDGIFSKGEWDDAVNYNIPGNCKIFMKKADGNLYIGLKSEKPFVCDLWITFSGNPIYQLHVSGALAQAVINSFPFNENDSKLLVLGDKNWAANYLTENKAKEAAWIGAGKPKGEKYWEIFDWAGALEYKINLKSLNILKNSLRIKINYYNGSGEYSYPLNSTGKNADNWLEIILPGQK